MKLGIKDVGDEVDAQSQIFLDFLEVQEFIMHPNPFWFAEFTHLNPRLNKETLFLFQRCREMYHNWVMPNS